MKFTELMNRCEVIPESYIAVIFYEVHVKSRNIVKFSFEVLTEQKRMKLFL